MLVVAAPAVKLTRSVQLSAGPMGLVALLNVVLLLLFFFLLGSSFVLQPGIAVSLPFSPYNLAPQANARLVTLQGGPPLRIYLQDRAVNLEELGRQLAAYRGSPRSIILRADRGTPYEWVIAVVNEALRQDYTVALATVPAPEAVAP
jgi:biopolymer transport protein ExbD